MVEFPAVSRYLVCTQYVDAFKNLAKSSNTVLLPEKTGDVSSMVAQVSVVCVSVVCVCVCGWVWVVWVGVDVDCCWVCDWYINLVYLVTGFRQWGSTPVWSNPVLMWEPTTPKKSQKTLIFIIKWKKSSNRYQCPRRSHGGQGC